MHNPHPKGSRSIGIGRGHQLKQAPLVFFPMQHGRSVVLHEFGLSVNRGRTPARLSAGQNHAWLSKVCLLRPDVAAMVCQRD